MNVRGAAGDILQTRHLVVELLRPLVRILFIQRKPHRNAHEEVLRGLARLLLFVLDGIAVEKRGEAGILKQLVALKVKTVR